MKVCILLSTYNGEKYIDDILKSIYLQKTQNKISILVRDDGSKDNTMSCLKRWKSKLDISIIQGENIGARDSFLELIKKAPNADFYAYCDQDDIWKESKIESAVNELIRYDKCIPLLYTCNIQCVNENLQELAPLNQFKQSDITMQRIFVSNCILGCTMVFNRKLLENLRNVDFSCFFMHDVVTVLTALVTGQVIYDENKQILYRQQENSVTQKQAQSFRKKMKNSYILWFCSQERSIARQAEQLLKHFENIDQKDRQDLQLIKHYKKGINRFRIMRDLRYRSNRSRENRSFLIRVFLGLA